MAKHNKKRNVGLMHEQLIRHVSECMVNQDQENADKAIKILENHFKKDSELYKEFRLFNSLVHTNVQDRDIAKRIIDESRIACKKHNSNKLNREKSVLIKDINHGINDADFYSRRIDEYKVFSTVQALLNEWRGCGKLYPEETVEYESVLEEWLTRSKKKDVAINDNANPLVLSIMLEKFNKKYDKKLNAKQKNLLEAKLISDKASVVNQVDDIKKAGLKALNKFYGDCDNNFLMAKKAVVLEKINKMGVGSSDAIVQKALSLASLIDELESDDE